MASLAWGLAIVRILRLRLNRLECLCIGYVLGAAIVSTLGLMLSLLTVARKGVFLPLAVVSATALIPGLRWLRSCAPTPLKSIPLAMRLLFITGFVIYGVLYLRQALTPETSPDAMSYHLGLVNLWNQAHGMRQIIDMYAALPDGIEMLFFFAFTIGRHSAADLIHLSFLMTLPLLMILYGVRFGFGKGSAALAALIMFVTPLVGWDGSVAYNDVALATVIFAAFFLVQLWRSERSAGLLVAAGLAAGFSLAIKYTAVFGILFLGAIILWQFRRYRRLPVRQVVIAVAVAAAVSLPYFIRNYCWFQNPIAFFGNSFFPNPYFHASSEQSYIQGQIHLNGVTWSELPMELTIGGSKLPESLGPFYLLAPLLLAGLVWRESRLLVLGFLSVGSAYAMNKSARFMIPALPLGLLALAFVLSRLPRLAGLVIGVVALAELIVCWPDVIDKIGTPRGEHVARTPWRVALRMTPEENYLLKASDDYVMARGVETHVPGRQTVFALAGGVAQAYTSHFILDSYHSAHSLTAASLFYSNAESERNGRRAWRVGFPEARLQRVEILQKGHSAGDTWSVNEVQLFRLGERVRPGSVLADAAPNPWDAGLIVDDLEATRWMSWDPMRPGMRIGLSFAGRPLVDRLDIRCGEGQWDSVMEVRVQAADGQWATPVSASWVTTPPLDLRKRATEVLKSWGIHYVIISEQAWRQENYRRQPEAWGLREVFATRGATLYEIN